MCSKKNIILKREILEKIYLTFIRPLLVYSCEVWDNCSQTDNDRLEKLQLEATRIAPGLTAFSSRDSVYKETGWEKLSSTRERKKLCLMYNMYHGQAPSYLCDLLPPLVRDVTNYPVRNRNDRCRLSLYQSSFIPSVINLSNSLDNDTRNTRTSDSFKINLKIKVVLAKIPAHFLVGDRRHKILSQAHGAWISFPPPPFSLLPPFFQNFHINHSFFKIVIIIRFFFI